MLIIDAHLDLSMNALEWNRDLRLPVADIRRREEGLTDKLDRGKGMVSLPALRKGGVGLVVATQIARYVEEGSVLPGWHSPQQAWAQTQGQLAWYKAMEAEGEMVMIRDGEELERHLGKWSGGEDGGIGEKRNGEEREGYLGQWGEGVEGQWAGSEKGGGSDEGGEKVRGSDKERPVGYILSLEGADSLVNLSYLETAYGYGLRAIGPAHYGPGRYAPGTGMEGPFTSRGLELLKEMDRLNMILDVTHLTDEAFWQAMELYTGPVWASHHNCRSLVQHQRQLADDQLKVLIERGAVIGGVLDAWMLGNGWVRGVSDPLTMGVGLSRLLDHYDHICQLAGNSRHIAIGSDLDGMFGKEQAPHDMDTIADLTLLPGLLKKRGYNNADVAAVMHGNWLRSLREAFR